MSKFEERPSLFYQQIREIRRDYDKFKFDVTTKIIKNDINYAILNRLNLIIDIHGHSGTGKSENAQSLVLYWQKRSKKLINRDAKIHLTFARWQTLNAINQASDGDIILQDEDTRLSGHGSSTAVDQMNNLIDIIRETQISFIFVSPHEKATLSQVNFYIETCLKDLRNRRNLVKVYNAKSILEGHALINLHKDVQFRKDYLEKKRENIKRLKESRGRDSVHIREEQLDEDYKLVLETSQEKGISLNNKSSIELCAKLAGVSGHTDYFKTLILYIEKTKLSQDSFNIVNLQKAVTYNDNYFVLRDLFTQYFQSKFNIPVAYSRVCTSMILWQNERFTRKKKKIYPSTCSLNDMMKKDIATEWKDQVSQQSIYQAINDHQERYGEVWNQLNTHDLEKIGEQYAYTLAKKALENLNSLSASPPALFLKQSFKDSYHLQEGSQHNKPFDLCLLSEDDLTAKAIFNVKLLTTKKSSSETRFAFGINHPRKKILWKIETRTFQEKILQVEKESITTGKGRGKEKEGLGSHSEKETTLAKIFTEIIEGIKG